MGRTTWEIRDIRGREEEDDMRQQGGQQEKDVMAARQALDLTLFLSTTTQVKMCPILIQYSILFIKARQSCVIRAVWQRFGAQTNICVVMNMI